MTGIAEIYLTAHGQWAAGHSFNGEKAQIGVRMCVEAVASAPTKGSIFDKSIGGVAALVAASVAGVNGTLTQTWDGNTGNPILGLNFIGTYQADACDDMWTFLNAIKGLVTPSFSWTHCKIAPIMDDGKYGAPSSTYTFTTPLAGTGTLHTELPVECAAAVTFRAPVLGRRGRGRFYVPGLTNAQCSDGTITNAAADSLKAAAVNLVNNLQNLPGGPFTYMPIVAVTSAGQTKAVRPSEVRVGNHWDVQRRRQAQVPETYRSTAL